MKALRIILAGVLAFGAGAGLGIAYDAPAHADSSVTASNPTDAYRACYLAYAETDVPTYFDCVNAATAYFYGPGHHSRFFNV